MNGAGTSVTAVGKPHSSFPLQAVTPLWSQISDAKLFILRDGPTVIYSITEWIST